MCKIFLCLCYRESEDGEVWYYSTPTQLDELIDTLDANDMEAALCRELSDFREEMVRQMEITEKLTSQSKGNKKSYFDYDNGESVLCFCVLDCNAISSSHLLNLLKGNFAWFFLFYI